MGATFRTAVCGPAVLQNPRHQGQAGPYLSPSVHTFGVGLPCYSAIRAGRRVYSGGRCHSTGGNHIHRALLINDHPIGGGIGRYVRHLYNALLELTAAGAEPGVDLLLQNVPGGTTPAEWSRVEGPAEKSRVMVQPRPRWAKQTGFGTIYQFTAYHYFPRRIPPGYALYHISSQMMGHSARWVSPAVVTVHDLVALRLASNHPRIRSWLRRRHLAALMAARRLIFISEYTRRDFLSRYQYPEERTAVIHHGVSDAFFPSDQRAGRAVLGLDENQPVLLHVGSEERRKNVETLLKAVAFLAEERPDLLLLRVGGRSARCRRLIERLGIGRNVRYLHNLAESTLVTCYQTADVFVFPSTFEGFGLPVLEAFRSGCPVVAGDATSVPEVTGDAAILVDPMDARGLAHSVSRVLDDPGLRGTLRSRGGTRAADFTWQRTAALTLAVYRQILESR